jgi:hypothetical protein
MNIFGCTAWLKLRRYNQRRILVGHGSTPNNLSFLIFEATDIRSQILVARDLEYQRNVESGVYKQKDTCPLFTVYDTVVPTETNGSQTPTEKEDEKRVPANERFCGTVMYVSCTFYTTFFVRTRHATAARTGMHEWTPAPTTTQHRQHHALQAHA